MKNTTLIILFVFSFSHFFSQADTCLVNSEIGISFPPVANALQRNFAKNHLDSLGIKRIRFGENWSLREPSQGNFNWSPLDDRILWADSNNYEVLLTVQSNGPNWACGLQNAQSCVFTNNNNFKTYIDSLLKRHPNKIDKIQFGNEWQSDFWYVGNAQEFIDANNILYNSVQTYSPTTQVVLGGFTTISLRFLAGCNNYVNSFYDDDGILYDSAFLAANCPTSAFTTVKNRIDSVLNFANYDIIDLHLYDDSEQWDEYVANFIDTISTPILVSEFGGPNMNLEPYTQAYQANKLFQYIKKLDSLEISEIYYFKLVEGSGNPAHSTSGLIDDTTLLPKKAYSIIKSFIDCEPVSLIENKNNLGNLTLYPNPAKNSVSIEFNTSVNSSVDLQVFSSTGQLVIEKYRIIGNKIVLNTESLNSGLYFFRIKEENKITRSGKLIIEK